jgi:hypothetical protein
MKQAMEGLYESESGSGNGGSRRIDREFKRKRGESTGHSKESGVKEERVNIINQTRERFSRFFYRFSEGESSADV